MSIDVVNEKDYAALVGISVSLARKQRVYGTGPRYLKLGSSVRYRLSDIQDWLDSRAVASTSDADMRRVGGQKYA